MADKKQELYKAPAILTPSFEEIQGISNDLRLKCTTEEIEAFEEIYKGTQKAYQRINELSSLIPQLPVKYPRCPGYRDEDNAWYWKCDIKGAPTGKLAGKTVALKDTICVAGVPLMNGSKIWEGYTPEFDATIVTRILDAGGNIKGKAVCEDMCLSSSSFTTSYGPLRNPYDETRTTGGSSCGSGLLVARGDVDMAIGGDQGGSVRIPACWCGLVGLKPTWGLVPYTGAIPMEITLDHLGPITKTVKDCADLLEVLAGYDNGNDPRQLPNIQVPEYSKLIDSPISGKRIAVLKEGFNNCDPGIAECVRKAVSILEEAGAITEEVSIPLHLDASCVWASLAFEGSHALVTHGNGCGYNWKGHYASSMQEAFARGYNLRPFDLPYTVKMSTVFAEYIRKNYQNKFYAKAQNIARVIKDAYDSVLNNYDVLVMPTMKKPPNKLPAATDKPLDIFQKALRADNNTAHFNVTGHPALTIKAGFSEGLPVGLMIVGKMFDDVTVLQIAKSYEQLRQSDAPNQKIV